jgi:hypothetical protein
VEKQNIKNVLSCPSLSLHSISISENGEKIAILGTYLPKYDDRRRRTGSKREKELIGGSTISVTAANLLADSEYSV